MCFCVFMRMILLEPVGLVSQNVAQAWQYLALSKGYLFICSFVRPSIQSSDHLFRAWLISKFCYFSSDIATRLIAWLATLGWLSGPVANVLPMFNDESSAEQSGQRLPQLSTTFCLLLRNFRWAVNIKLYCPLHNQHFQNIVGLALCRVPHKKLNISRIKKWNRTRLTEVEQSDTVLEAISLDHCSEGWLYWTLCSSVQHDHPSLHSLKLIIFKTIPLLDLGEPCNVPRLMRHPVRSICLSFILFLLAVWSISDVLVTVVEVTLRWAWPVLGWVSWYVASHPCQCSLSISTHTSNIF